MMGSIAEKTLGKRAVFYMRNEAMVGRITRHRLQTLASILGVSSIVKMDLDECHDGDVRYRVMGEVLDAWCTKGTLRGVDANKLSSALDQARLTYHAQAIREMSGNGSDNGLIKAPLPASARSITSIRSSHTLPPASANGYSNHHSTGKRGSKLNRMLDQGGRAVSSSLSHLDRRRSDGGTEEGSDTSSTFHAKSALPDFGEDDIFDKSEILPNVSEEDYMAVQPPTSPTKRPFLRRSRPSYTVSGKMKSPKKKKSPIGDDEERSENGMKLPAISSASNDTDESGPLETHRIGNGDIPNRVHPSRISANRRPLIDTPSALRSRRETFKPKNKDRELHKTFTVDKDREGNERNHTNKKLQRSPRRRVKSDPRSARKSPNVEPSETIAKVFDDEDDSFIAELRKSKIQKIRKVRKKPLREAEESTSPRKRASQASRSKSPNTMGNPRARGATLIRDKTPPNNEASSSPRKSNHRFRQTRSESPTKRAPFSPSKRHTKPKITIETDAIEDETKEATSPTKKSRHGVAKYGSWRELQKLSKEVLKIPPEDPDTVEQDIANVIKTVAYLSEAEKSTYAKSILQKVRSEKFLGSLCQRDKDYLYCVVRAMASFGTDIALHTRTQVLVYYTLERMRSFWINASEPIPSAEEITKHQDTMDFLRNAAKLCYNVSNTEQIVVTGVIENDRRHKRVWLLFKQFGVRILKKNLEQLGIVKFQNRGPFLAETGNFLETHFIDSLFIDFLGVLHTHAAEEDISDFSKQKLVTTIPLLCGLSSKEKSPDQKIVAQMLDGMTGVRSKRDPLFYVKFLEHLWMESQQTFLNAVYEARLRKITIYPPPGDRQIVLALARLYPHDVIPLAYYLHNIDHNHVQLEGLMLQDCGLDDSSLKILGKTLFQIGKIQMTGNYFTMKGIFDLTKTIKGLESIKIRSLDLTDSNIEDECLGKLGPLLPALEELVLSENFITWYGIRKITQPHKKTKRLRKLDMSRCHLNEHAFYEMIPLTIKTEEVTLEGNEFTPLEMKIFARQIREAQTVKLETLNLTNCQLDDECLAEIAKFATKVANLILQANVFSHIGIKAFVKYCKKHEMGNLKSINLKGCKMKDSALEELAQILPNLESAILSSNNFSSATGVKQLVESLTNADTVNLKYLELRHCKLLDGSKRMLGDVAKKNRIEVKMF
ncbi:hypothetical protein TCAL_08134 [Tigriopus californicus]|uniref:Uncharacterized protein n=2 Tax=Tigriopus californicus TaxID=6832 RepID=A0A553PJK7_TIGCA|nr:uncharacterized protein LOC131890493 isoform X2 [Tigriopus californicus]TRY77862.1 hypothetical protein TCAL_08134 [Tigriopus californicus]|eukprot:TCALIF_08134-PA protein Name:"Similar to NLRP12 NACHT, LRR and PYD domains-containing protein 12 (Homo sapiens)" AED:0.43 eAED:0.43 QI:1/1/0.66/1/1/1/3/0/1170